jgi:hypothetical protein
VLKRRLFGFALPLLLLAGCGGTTAAGSTTVTVQVPTTVFVTGSDPAAAPAPSTEAAAAPAPVETAAAAVPPVGASIPFTWSSFGDEDQGVATLNTAEWSTEPLDQFSGPPKNGALLILDVTVEGTQGSVSVSPIFWEAKDVEGRTYDVTITSKEPSLASGDVGPGEKSRGFVVIDAPQVPLTVQLSSIGSGAVASWAVPA